ncbi:MAG TPA: nitrophenyl compound nitroreductase subunit ArsF family protein [Thermoguttaceae bacterium]|nr:nitrophenyl compound nitroreductase subunit ArsF family protein [Thermoguttaceae bacterium]
MKPKNVVTIGLLMFVGACIMVLTVKALRPSAPPPVAANPAAAAGVGSPEAEEPMDDGVIAYYFHGNTRCPTCRAIESYAHEAVQAGFAEQLESGKLKWQVVNYELPGNEHFATDYEIFAPTVVVVEISDGSQQEWKNLDRVWELVDDKDAFVQYVQSETETMLQGTSG